MRPFALLFVSVAAVALRAQAPVTGAAPRFEAASIKRNTSASPEIRFMAPPGGRLTVTSAPVKELLRFAYQVQPFQLVGAPSWVDTERFDVIAKGPEDTPATIGPPTGNSPSPIQRMVQSLLAERFRLETHRETREMPIYALVLNRADGTLGPRMRASAVDCSQPRPAQAFAAGERPPCSTFGGIGSLTATGVPLSQLTNILAPRLGRFVADRTGLTGNYEFTLDFAPDQGPREGGAANGPLDPDRPSIFTALQEQLGLKLDSQRGPVDVVVIDRIEHPTDD